MERRRFNRWLKTFSLLLGFPSALLCDPKYIAEGVAVRAYLERFS